MKTLAKYIFCHLSIFPSAAPASFEPEKSHLCSGPRWPEMEQRLSQNWNWRIVRVKYLRGKQEHTLFNDLRRKLAKRSKELVNCNNFFALLKKYKI